MATFDFQSVSTYEISGNDATQLVEVNFTGQLDDGDAGDPANFEPGEVVLTDGPADFIYLGTVSEGAGDRDLILVQSSVDPMALRLYSSDLAASTNFPAVFDITDVDESPVCFAAGTLIATLDGETAVESLQAGDTVRTADGGTTTVKWIGRQTLAKMFSPRERLAPVRVKAGTLADGVPHTDLVLTADHALIIDGLAINAGALVNGVTIVRDPIDSLPERVTYYHIETEGHEVILANGTPAETYVDYVQRRVFDNYGEYVELFGDEQNIDEMPLPRISSARLVPESIRARLGEAAKVA